MSESQEHEREHEEVIKAKRHAKRNARQTEDSRPLRILACQIAFAEQVADQMEEELTSMEGIDGKDVPEYRITIEASKKVIDDLSDNYVRAHEATAKTLRENLDRKLQSLEQMLKPKPKRRK